MDELTASLGEVLTGQFEVDPDALAPDAAFEDLGIDSLAQVELAEVLEQRFDVTIGDDEMAAVITVSGLVSMLQQKTAPV